MSGTVSLTGTLQGNPSSGTTFPSASFTSQVSLLNGSKLYQNATGVLCQSVASPSPDFATLVAVGPGGSVPQADTLMVRTATVITLRITQDDGSGGDVVSTFTLQGTFLMEATAAQHIKLVEVQGTGIIEYFASGQ